MKVAFDAGINFFDTAEVYAVCISLFYLKYVKNQNNTKIEEKKRTLCPEYLSNSCITFNRMEDLKLLWVRLFVNLVGKEIRYELLQKTL